MTSAAAPIASASWVELAALLGHRLAEGAMRAYQSGVSQAAAALGVTPAEALARTLRGEPAAFRAVISRVTIQETYF
jgi:hypothetical protein